MEVRREVGDRMYRIETASLGLGRLKNRVYILKSLSKSLIISL